MADTSLDKHDNVPEEEIVIDTPVSDRENGDKGLSTKEDNEVDEKTKQGFQRLIAKKDQDLSKAQLAIEEANQKLAAFEAAEKERKLSEMTEAERLKTERDEYATKFAKAELKSFVVAEMTKRNLMNFPLAEEIIETPWMLRAVRSHLSVQPDWEETIEAVKQYLPAYLDTLVVPEEKVTPSKEENSSEPSDTPPTPMPSERGEPAVTPGNKRNWTKAEIASIQKDPVKWMKYRGDITLAYTEGRVI